MKIVSASGGNQMIRFKRSLVMLVTAGMSFTVLGGAHSQGLQQLVDAAKKEASNGDFFVSITQPNQDATYRALFQAFEKRFDLSLHYQWQSHHEDYYPLVIAEAGAGRRTPDVMSGSTGDMLILDKAGLLENYDWQKYSAELPGLADAVESTIPPLRGKSLAHFDVIYTLVYNTKLIAMDAVPRTIEELSDPKWIGKLALNSMGSPLEILGIAIGHDRVLDIAQKLKANRPVFKVGAPGVVVAVANGETPIGFGYTTGSDVQKSKGAPVDWLPLKDYVPVLQQDVTVLKSAQHPNLARLFAAWLASDEGLQIQEKMEFMGRATARGTRTWQRLNEMSPKTQIVEAKSVDDLALTTQMRKEITKILTQ
jgi:iron(III) transport system substrate-binding protein